MTVFLRNWLACRQYATAIHVRNAQKVIVVSSHRNMAQRNLLPSAIFFFSNADVGRERWKNRDLGWGAPQLP
jgi:hypothetical protein